MCFYIRSNSSNSYNSNNCNSNSNSIIYSACNKMFQSKECKDCQCQTSKQCKVQLACKDCNKTNSYPFNQIIHSRFWRNKRVTILFSIKKRPEISSNHIYKKYSFAQVVQLSKAMEYRTSLPLTNFHKHFC